MNNIWEDMLQGFEWGPDNARLEDQRAQMEVVEQQLENDFADRNLKFSRGFHGASPMQACGRIDNMRFHFKFRADRADLRVGPYNRDLEQLIFQKQEEARLQRMQEDYEAWERGEITGPELRLSLVLNKAVPFNDETYPDYFPTEAYYYAAFDECTGNPYRGILLPVEAYEIFSELVDALQEVPEERRLLPFTRKMLGLDD